MNFTDTKIFIDTNILAYMFDMNFPEKQRKARNTVSKLITENACCISTQVLQELFNVLSRKLKYSKEEAEGIITNLMEMNVHQVSNKDISKAMAISIQTQFTIYDSLIIAAAKAENCNVVFSEDLCDGQIVDNIKIGNPFKSLA